MFLVGIFLLFTCLICSLQFKELVERGKHNNVIVKALAFFTKNISTMYPKFSPVFMATIVDCIKCPLFVVFSACLFHEKYIIDFTAIVACVAHYFPIFNDAKNGSKNFVGLILTSFVLNPITGISMFISFFIVANNNGHFAVATASAMIVGTLKTLINILLLGDTNYVETSFIITFSALAIYRNKRALLYIFAKASPRSKKTKFENRTCNSNSNDSADLDKDTLTYMQSGRNDTHDIDNDSNIFSDHKISRYKKHEARAKVKGMVYRKYKSVYKNNHVYEVHDKKYDCEDFDYTKPHKVRLSSD